MQTQAFQLTLYLPNDTAQPAVALPKPDRPRVKELSLREAAIQYLGELPDGEKPVNRLLHYGAGALANDELLACVFGLNGHGHADAQHLLSAFEGLPGLAQATVYELQQQPGIGPAQVHVLLKPPTRSWKLSAPAAWLNRWRRPFCTAACTVSAGRRRRTNQILVHLFGFEDAATYKQWQALGRQVKRGSTAIYLMRPNLKLARVTDEETAEERTVQAGLRGFGWFPVHGLEDTVPIPGFQGQGL